MYISWYVVLAGIASILAVPSIIILFRYNPKLAKIVILAALLVIMILNVIYWVTGEPVSL